MADPRPGSSRRREALRRGERLIEIGENIVDMLQPDR